MSVDGHLPGLGIPITHLSSEGEVEEAAIIPPVTTQRWSHVSGRTIYAGSAVP